jgi:3-oxoacyl-[acyl-carrier-protein] synthase III
MKIVSIVSAVPANIENNQFLPFDYNELQKIIETSGIQQKRIANAHTTSSSLCKAAADHIFYNLDINKSDIGILVFVTQYPDFILPSTVHILQHQLGLDTSVVAIQINEGCAGYIYGLHLIKSLLLHSPKEFALLLVGDTTSKVIDQNDQSTRPLFGDAGSATLLSKTEINIQTLLGGDGSGEADIKVENNCFKNGFDQRPTLKMDGMNVFMFGISRVPKYVEEFLTMYKIDKNKIDFLVLHQANKMMNDRISRKLGFSQAKSLQSLQYFGNTSNASIPLTISTNLKNKYDQPITILACGFGVGLAWGVANFVLDSDVYLDLIEI